MHELIMTKLCQYGTYCVLCQWNNPVSGRASPVVGSMDGQEIPLFLRPQRPRPAGLGELDPAVAEAVVFGSSTRVYRLVPLLALLAIKFDAGWIASHC